MRTKYLVKKEETSAEQHAMATPHRVWPHSAPSRLIQLQQSLGNRSVRRLFKAGVIQAKLKIGRPADKFEQEANRVAEAVVRMPDPALRTEEETGSIRNASANLIIQRDGTSQNFAGEKIVTVDFVLLPGYSGNPLEDLEFANSVFSQCCVRFVVGQGVSVDRSLSDEWLGGNTRMKIGGREGIHQQEAATFDGATKEFGLSSRIRVFYVGLTDPVTPGFSIIPSMAPSKYGRFVDIVVVSTAFGYRKTLAHELGHLLLDSDEHRCESKDNLMCPTPDLAAGGGGVKLEPEQCAMIYENA